MSPLLLLTAAISLSLLFLSHSLSPYIEAAMQSLILLLFLTIIVDVVIIFFAPMRIFQTSIS